MTPNVLSETLIIALLSSINSNSDCFKSTDKVFHKLNKREDETLKNKMTHNASVSEDKLARPKMNSQTYKQVNN